MSSGSCCLIRVPNLRRLDHVVPGGPHFDLALVAPEKPLAMTPCRSGGLPVVMFACKPRTSRRETTARAPPVSPPCTSARSRGMSARSCRRRLGIERRTNVGHGNFRFQIWDFRFSIEGPISRKQLCLPVIVVGAGDEAKVLVGGRRLLCGRAACGRPVRIGAGTARPRRPMYPARRSSCGRTASPTAGRPAVERRG